MAVKLLNLIFVLLSLINMSQTIYDSSYFKSLSPVDFTLMHTSNTDVIYRLFNNPQDETGIFLQKKECKGISPSLNRTLPTVLFIHGWTTDDTSPWYRPLKNEFFKKGPHNIIYINWSKAGNQSYPVSSANTEPVGKSIAKFLMATGVPPGNIHIIGHSLGAHLSGFIGKFMYKLTGHKIGRITGLDAAGPKFENPGLEPHRKLHQDDAIFVDVVHTDIGFFGFSAPMGHVDFYPNLGKLQPGCPARQVEENCNHARSVKYFLESVNANVYAKKARYSELNGNVEIVVDTQDTEDKIIFGENVDTTARGQYYFETNSREPFLKIINVPADKIL